MSHAEVLVLGAGASGLAVAAALTRRGRAPVVLDRDTSVGGTWARRYERLHLHTVRRFSGLPFYPIPRSQPRYVPAASYAAYLAEYAARLGIDVRLGEDVQRIRPHGAEWIVVTRRREWSAPAVVIATGRHNVPRLPEWPGAQGFQGRVLHSHEYASGRPFAGKRALVIGIGNSGAEIATDLVECGAASVAISVRTPPPITPREIAGIPVQLLGMMLAPFPPRIVDRLGAVLRRIGTGDLRRYGLGKERWGPFTARRPPMIDVGFLAQLKAGRIEVRADIARFVPDGVIFADGTKLTLDVVVAATGYTTGLASMLELPNALDDREHARADARHAGLYFAGYWESPRGLLYESARAARKLAKTIDRYLEQITTRERGSFESAVEQTRGTWPRGRSSRGQRTG